MIETTVFTEIMLTILMSELVGDLFNDGRDVCRTTVIQVMQRVDCSVHSSPTIITETTVDLNEQRRPSEISEIAVSPVNCCRVVVNVSRCRAVLLSVDASW